MIRQLQISGAHPVVLDGFHLANNDVVVFRGTVAPHEWDRLISVIAQQFPGRDVLALNLGTSDVSVEHLDEDDMARRGWIRANKKHQHGNTENTENDRREPVDMTDATGLPFTSYRKTALTSAVRMDHAFRVRTPSGMVTAEAGDYLCEGVEGERWPVKASVFEASYESVAFQLTTSNEKPASEGAQ